MDLNGSLTHMRQTECRAGIRTSQPETTATAKVALRTQPPPAASNRVGNDSSSDCEVAACVGIVDLFPEFDHLPRKHPWNAPANTAISPRRCPPAGQPLTMLAESILPSRRVFHQRISAV